jgi:hypothetical protein
MKGQIEILNAFLSQERAEEILPNDEDYGLCASIHVASWDKRKDVIRILFSHERAGEGSVRSVITWLPLTCIPAFLVVKSRYMLGL